MKKGFTALESGDWEEYQRIFRVEKRPRNIKEAFEQVVRYEAEQLSIVQEIMIRSTGCLRRIIAPAGGQRRRYDVFPLYKTTSGCFWSKKRNNLWCGIGKEKYDWKQSNSLFVVQTSEGIYQVEVVKAHAVPQDLCANLINVLNLLANQQEDGDGLIQNIVTNFCEVSKRSLTNWLREFIQVDNHRAREVGHLKEGLGSF